MRVCIYILLLELLLVLKGLCLLRGQLDSCDLAVLFVGGVRDVLSLLLLDGFFQRFLSGGNCT